MRKVVKVLEEDKQNQSGLIAIDRGNMIRDMQESNSFIALQCGFASYGLYP
jgi:hypothetical protein